MKKKEIFLLLLCIFYGIGVILYNNLVSDREPKTEQGTTVVERVVVYDTITYRKPISVDSTVVRYVTVNLPISKVDTLKVMVDTLQTESVAVELPITKTEYADTTYRAWVSGYRAQLDSIQVYPLKEVVTLMQKKPSKRWGIGIQAGYGFTPKNGLQPYIGVGIVWNIYNF